MLAALGLWASERPPVGLVLLAAPLWAAAWVWRWLRIGRPTRATPLDLPLIAFLLTALVGLWAAPEQPAALVRLDFFLGAIGLYYVLVNNPQPARQAFAYGLGALAALLAIYFASQHDWSNGPAKIAAIGRLGQILNHRVPQLGLYQPNPNVIANLLALVLPIAVLQSVATWADWRSVGWVRRLGAALSGLSAIFIVFGLLMSESRDSVLALAGAAGVGAWWWLAGQLERHAQRNRLAIFAVGLGAGVIFIGLAALAVPNLITLALGSLPGPNSAISRSELFAQVWRLAQDTPFTGGGLGAFPGLYSTYILDVPNLFLTHAHNIFLNILVEQGWPGLITFVLVLVTGLAAGMRRLRQPAPGRDVLVGAGLLGLAVLILQGLGDGTLVASRITLAWLVPAGLAVGAPLSATGGATEDIGKTNAPLPAARLPTGLRWTLAVLAGVGCLGLLTWHSWLAAWYANMGSVEFARVQLAGWPTNSWSDGRETPQLLRFAPLFEHALALSPKNVTAAYRLGLLAMLQRDFPTAVQDLAEAHGADSGHRGIVKALAYAYVWSADNHDAEPLLRTVPEAAGEMAVYTWWWGTQGRPDLARLATSAAKELGTSP